MPGGLRLDETVARHGGVLQGDADRSDGGVGDDTLFCDGGKLGNQIQIRDSLSIGDHAAMAGWAGVAAMPASVAGAP